MWSNPYDVSNEYAGFAYRGVLTPETPKEK